MFSVDMVHFQGGFQFLLNITAGLTSFRLETIMAPSIHASSIALVSKSDHNKTDGH